MKLINIVKNHIKMNLLKIGIWIGPTTSASNLAAFFSRIQPISTEHELLRLGGKRDGGYLIPNDLDKIEACFSPGVDKVASFELALIKKGIPCFLADYSVQEAPVKHKLISFEKKFLGAVSSSIFITLESWVKKNAPQNNDLLLQMDIESAEYPVILSVDKTTLNRFRILVIEFHDLDSLLDHHAFEVINQTFIKLLKDYEIVHIHPNNCRKTVHFQGFSIPPVVEITFHRKDRIKKRKIQKHFPHKLDVKNISYFTDITLPSCWINK